MNAGRTWNRGKVYNFQLSRPSNRCPARRQNLRAIEGKCPLCGITVQTYPDGVICQHS